MGKGAYRRQPVRATFPEFPLATLERLALTKSADCAQPHWLSDLYRRHHRELVRFASRLVGDRDGGEEVVQNAYVKLTARDKAAGVIEKPVHYAMTATRHAAIDLTAKRQSEWLYRVDFETIDPASLAYDPGHRLEERQKILRLAVFLNELPRDCQTAFLMNKVEGRSHREIAGALGISVSMVEKHMMRALRHCRTMMRDLW